MADPLLVSSIKVLLEKTLSLATDGIGLIFGFKKDLETLRGSAAMICAVLADAEDKQRHNQFVQNWLKRLEGVAFEAENVLDELHYEKLRRQLKGKVCSFFLSSKANIVLRWRMASKVKDINMNLKMINDEANGFGLMRSQKATPLPNTLVNRQTDSVSGQNVVGRVNDEQQIVETLLSSSEKAVSVIPIIGMGGLGKTTLAQSVYNNQQIDRHFEKKIWVCVSENFEVTRLLKLILESLTRRNVEIASRDAIVQEIRGQLQGKRYLLVLDDVWTEAPILWDDFFHSLVGLNTTKGNWCFVTTRKQQTAFIVATHHPYVLGKLSDDDCWSILKDKVIADGEVLEKLNVIRVEIIKRCRGVPLAASVLGGLLHMKRNEEWHSILDNTPLNLSGDKDSITQILKLSFDYLPSPSIKKCFAYCSIFDKDTKLDSNLLIELWMAEGFLQPDLKNEIMMEEELGEKYFRILLQSSLVEEVQHELWGGTYYKMHDLVHDLAESVSKSERIKFESNAVDNNSQVRYVVVNSFGETTDKILKNMSTSVRTLFLENSISGGMLSNFKNLHVLNLSGARTKELPNTIGKLIHLRHIDVSYSTFQSLPESLCKLYNLQTLRILGCHALKYLPKGMSKLLCLRHLHYYNYDENFQMPMEMGRLTYLQTLKFFNVGQEKGRGIDELECLKDLKGSLVIRNLELVKGEERAEKANLLGKANLFRLKFEWFSSNREGDNYDEDVLEGLQPHPNLKELAIERFLGDKFPLWLMNLSTSLHKLVRLRLRNCKKCRELPALGKLSFLQDLVVDGLENVRRIGLPFYGIHDRMNSSCELSRKLFPSLKTLCLLNMGNLEEWMEVEAHDVVVFPVLESLEIYHCSQLITAPSHFPSLKKLDVTKNDHVLVVQNILSKVTSTISSLTIYGMAVLTCVSDVAATAGGLHKNLPNLKHLTLWECPNLTSIRGCGTSLERLELCDCDNLRVFSEDASGFQSLRSLRVEGCPRIQFLNEGPQNLTSLEDLTIARCDRLTHLHGNILQFCTSLRRLQVRNCSNLVSFPLDLQQTPSLSEIDLCRCPKLKTNMVPKGFGFLTNLWHLQIGPFSDDDKNSSYKEFDWSGLVSSSTLRGLTLYGLPDMESLPDQLQYLTSLSELILRQFGRIEALPDWIGNLESLEHLSLSDCEKLKYLPSSDAMRRLTKLRSLYVSGCPLLKERCTPQIGADSEWSKISHIYISGD